MADPICVVCQKAPYDFCCVWCDAAYCESCVLKYIYDLTNPRIIRSESEIECMTFMSCFKACHIGWRKEDLPPEIMSVYVKSYSDLRMNYVDCVFEKNHPKASMYINENSDQFSHDFFRLSGRESKQDTVKLFKDYVVEFTRRNRRYMNNYDSCIKNKTSDVYKYKCPTLGCPGFIKENGECSVCTQKLCNKCWMPIMKSVKHTICDPTCMISQERKKFLESNSTWHECVLCKTKCLQKKSLKYAYCKQCNVCFHTTDQSPRDQLETVVINPYLHWIPKDMMNQKQVKLTENDMVVKLHIDMWCNYRGIETIDIDQLYDEQNKTYLTLAVKQLSREVKCRPKVVDSPPSD